MTPVPPTASEPSRHEPPARVADGTAGAYLPRYDELALRFDAADDAKLVGIVSVPSAPCAPSSTGVLIVVGGPQYRIGSHRQFVLLARALASHGIAAMRFDCAGMGDSSGADRGFTDRDDDIRAAQAAFRAAVPSLTSVALLGLCDGASASLMYAPGDASIRRLILLNPWVRSEAGLARTHLKHYYTARLVSRDFWRGLVGRRVSIGRALTEFVATVVRSRGGSGRGVSGGSGVEDAFPLRMARGWKAFGGDILLICAGDDLTAREFLDHAAGDAAWQGLLDGARVTVRHHPEADHTFSRAVWRERIVEWIVAWIGDDRPADRTEDAGARLFAGT